MEMLLTETKIKQKVISGVIVLGTRRILIQLIITISNIILARLLTPDIFGTFMVIQFIIFSCGLIANFGLGPALIQRQEKITTAQLRIIFTTTIAGALIVAGIIFWLAPLIGGLYKNSFGIKEVNWLRLFSIWVFLDNLTLVSKFLLQRHLEYVKLTFGEILVLFVTQISVIVLALKGMGVGSFIIGNLIGAVVNAILFFYLSPWSIGINFSISKIKSYFSFGLNFQISGIISALNNAVTPFFVGIISGVEAIGLINWAAGIRQVGLAPYDVIDRLMFPVASRAKKHSDLLKTLIEKMLKFSCLTSFPLLMLIYIFAPQLIVYIYTEKWLPGLTTLYLSLIQGIFILLEMVLANILMALGETKFIRNITLFWAILQWILAVPLVLIFGFNGVVIAGILVSTTFFIPLIYIKKQINFVFWRNVLPYILYSLITGALLYSLKMIIQPVSLINITSLLLTGVFFYIILILIFEKKYIWQDIIQIKKLYSAK